MHRAAAYWRWRVAELSQSRQQAIEDLLEARFHHHAAGDRDEAVEVTEWICLQLDTWGAWGWEQALLMETLAWLPERSAKAAAFQHGLGNMAYFRGDLDDALDWTRKALAIFEQLGARAGMASTLSQIGILHTEGGDPATGLCFNVQSLALRSQIGSPEIRIDMY